MKKRGKYINQLLLPGLINPEPSPLDASRGRANRDAGIKKAVANANKKTSDWSKMAYNYFVAFLNDRHTPFMCEDARVYAEQNGLPEPPSKRAWGMIILKAKKESIITRCGMGTVKNPNANNANASIWTKI